MNQRTRGILCLITSAFCFACMSAFVRLSGDLPSIQKSFFRNFVAVIFALIVLLREGEGLRPRRGSLPALFARATCGTIGILCNFYAVDHLVLSDASMLNKLSPFFAVLASILILREKVSWKQLLAIVIAFIGSLFIIKPTFSNAAFLPALIGFFGGMGAGFAYAFVRYLTEHGERKAYIVFFFSAFSCLVTLPFLIFDYHAMTLTQLLFLILAGLSAAGGQFSITAAYSYAPAREISVYDYSQIIFSTILGFFLFGQIPDHFSVLGYVIICGVALVTFFRQKREA